MRVLTVLLVGIAATGCPRSGDPGDEWQVDHGSAQSQTGPQSFATIHALGPPSSYNLVIECATAGLELSFGGRFPDSAAVLQFDEGAPMTVPTRASQRGVPVVDLRAPIEGTTVEALLLGASRIAVHAPATDQAEAVVVAFPVADAERAIRRLDCPP